MATEARERLARALRDDAKTASSVAVTARADDLILEVEGFGRVTFPVTPAKARKLIGLGQPARFGRGEQTLTDADVRDTWEIPRNLVRAQWNDTVLKVILATIKEELGLPNGTVLTADLHSLLVYEPNQFFLAHQDSEKDDSMVATLVVTLPSSYAGGELLVGHNEEWKAYRGSKTVLSLVAFYADCRHEVLKVKSGYRITLTYNLLLDGDTTPPAGDDAAVAALANLLSEHFATPAPRYTHGSATETPSRLVYLLDHEYTPRGLGWRRLKGADTSRAALLREAAERAGCEAILALADVKTTHSAFEDDEGYEYRSWDDEDVDDDEYDGDEGGDAGSYSIQELIDSEVTLTHWTGPDGVRLEETSLPVGYGEVCASTESDSLTPFDSQYEGYMGNWGNTLDRWYHRAAIVVWPREQAFANRAETSPAWALEELAARAEAGDVDGTQGAAGTLAPFWEHAARARAAAAENDVAGFFGQALRVAGLMEDPQIAMMLLRPFRVENLLPAHAPALSRLAASYGQPWAAGLLGNWFGDRKNAWMSGPGPERPRWVTAALPGLCTALQAKDGGGGETARRLLDLTWEWLSTDIGTGLTVRTPSQRAEALGRLGSPLAALLTAAAVAGARGTRDAMNDYVRSQPGEAVTVLELAALRAAADITADRATAASEHDAGFSALAADCAQRLRARLALPPRAAEDWSIELPVTHVTTRTGRPFTLVLRKTDALFDRERQARARDEADLQWLAATATRRVASR
jgi:hypothetical protein